MLPHRTRHRRARSAPDEAGLEEFAENCEEYKNIGVVAVLNMTKLLEAKGLAVLSVPQPSCISDSAPWQGFLPLIERYPRSS